MVYTNINSSFPSQVVPDAEKNSIEYGRLVGRAIENEWFRGCLLYTSPSPRDS